MKIIQNQGWSLISFGPVNLWNFPKQQRDYMMSESKRNVARDNAHRARTLNPRPRATAAQRPSQIEPAKSEADVYAFARAIHCKQFSVR